MPSFNLPIKIIQRLTGYQSLPEARLIFNVFQNDKGQFVVKVKALPARLENPISLKHPKKLDSYGKKIKLDGDLYSVNNEDYETMLSILDHSPDVTESGLLVFDIFPSELEFLKEQDNVKMSDEVKNIEINRNEKAEPALEVDMNSDEDLIVSPGYSVSEKEKVKKHQDKDNSPKGWIRIEDEFYKKPDLPKATQQFFDQGHIKIEDNNIPEFFLRDLALLDSELNTVITDQAKEIDVVDSTPEPSISVNKPSRGWLDFDIEYEIENVRLNQKELLNELENSDGSDYHKINSTTWLANESNLVKEYEEKLEDIGARKTKDGYKVEVSKYQSLEEFVEEIGGDKKATEAYKNFLKSLKDLSPDSSFSPGEETEKRLRENGIILRDYQRKGAHWLYWLQQNRLHGILADEMGLGKTLQVLVAMKKAYMEEKLNRPSLVVSPKSVLGHWEKEANKVFNPSNHSIRIYHGQNRNPEKLKRQEGDIFISTYGTIRRDSEKLAAYPLFYLVLDEATKIKNRSTKRSKAVKSLNSAHRVALSGTPIENRTSELWSIFDFLMKDHLGTYSEFQRKFASPIEKNQKKERSKKALEKLQNRIQAFFTRRSKNEVADELPEKITNEYFVELTKEQRTLYGRIQNSFKGNQVDVDKNMVESILPTLTKLKQVCIHPALIVEKETPIMGRSNKFDSVIDRLVEAVDENDQAVIFTQYLKSLDLLEKVLREKNIKYMRIDGSTNNRQELIDGFNQTGNGGEVALCSVKAAEHGINLQSANHVLHMDFWWNPATERQATDRVHRLGQEKIVQVHKFYVENTLEEKIKNLLERKRELANEVFQQDVSFLSQLSKSELMDILRPIN